MRKSTLEIKLQLQILCYSHDFQLTAIYYQYYITMYYDLRSSIQGKQFKNTFYIIQFLCFQYKCKIFMFYKRRFNTNLSNARKNQFFLLAHWPDLCVCMNEIVTSIINCKLSIHFLQNHLFPCQKICHVHRLV